MLTLIKVLSGVGLMVLGVSVWIYTPWWVWGAGLVVGGLGVLTFGSLKSYICLGAAGILILMGYTIQPDAVSILELLRG